MNEQIVQKTKKSNQGRTAGAQEFPFVTVEQALEVIKIVNTKSSLGIKQSLLAPLLNSKFHSSKFKNYIRAAYRYGMTTISYGQDDLEVKITELGKKFLKPTKSEDEKNIMFEFFQNAKLFKQYYEKLLNETLPEPQFGKNQIGDMGNLSETSGKIAFNVFSNNLTFLSLIDEHGVVISKQLSKQSNEHQESDDEITDDELDDEIPQNDDKETKEFIPKSFISHSKNMKILEQIKKILIFGKFHSEIAVEEETTAKPIPEKIFGLMRECNCAIINVSADEQEKREDGTYGINQNVLIEIGAAFLLYNERVILLVDKRVELPSNLHGLYQSRYEGDELSWDAGMKLQEALSKFRVPETD